MTSCIGIQCNDECIQNNMNTGELESELKNTQQKLSSSGEMNNLLLKKLKEYKSKITLLEEDCSRKISSLNSEKKELFSLLEEQKQIIDELMLREPHKTKKIRKQKAKLVDIGEEMIEDMKRLEKENENLEIKLADEGKRTSDNAKEIEMVRNEVKEKERLLKNKGEENAVLVSQNRIADLQLKECKAIMAKNEYVITDLEECLKEQKTKFDIEEEEKRVMVKETEEEFARLFSNNIISASALEICKEIMTKNGHDIVLLEESLKHEQEKLKKVVGKFEADNKLIQNELQIVQNEKSQIESWLIDTKEENESLFERLEELTSPIANYQTDLAVKDIMIRELETENETLKEKFLIVSAAKSEISKANSNMKKELKEYDRNIIRMKNELEENFQMEKEIKKAYEKLSEKMFNVEKKLEIVVNDLSALKTKRQKKFKNIFKRK